jgi:hypothetical protein
VFPVLLIHNKNEREIIQNCSEYQLNNVLKAEIGVNSDYNKSSVLLDGN